MFWFELKKIFAKKSSRIALLLLAVSLGIICVLAVRGVAYVNEQGETEYGSEARRKLREERLAWSGVLDEEKLAAVIEENRRITATEEYSSESVREENIAYSWGQGISDIRDMLNHAFCAFREYDYYRVNTLRPEDAADFYGNRTLRLREWLDSPEAENMFSESEKAAIIRSYETLETPFAYTWSEGWKQLYEYAPSVIMIMMLILGFLVTGIFSSEFSLKADAVFFASRYGRDRAVKAKMRAGVLLVTGVYWAVMLLYSAVILGMLGTDGADLPVQTGFGGWKSLFHITNFEEFIIIIVSGYIGCLFLALLTMVVSAWTQNAVLAVIVPFFFVFLPSFLAGFRSGLAVKITGLLPDRLLAAPEVLNSFALYEIGGRVVHALPILLTVYPLLAIALYLLLYRVYRRSEIR